MHKTFQKYN